ncbi:hypothetical protein ACHAW6_003321 [Cyclotella cf. meneghiniana]
MTSKRNTSNRPILLASLALLCSTPCHAKNLSITSLFPFQIEIPRTVPFTRRDGPHGRTFVHSRTVANGGSSCSFDSFNRSLIHQLRGGAISQRQSNSPAPKPQQPKSNRTNVTAITATVFLAFTILISILNWETLLLSLSTFFDKEKFRTSILSTLNSISARGTRGLITYTLGFILWETFGLPTSVVETAAGMAFGFQRGLVGSFVGKTTGSILAFLLGRTLCRSFVEQTLRQNETLELINAGVARHPMRTAFIVRYSVFPQLVKNYGLSITRPVSLPIFILAIVVHGLPFSILWAALGHDSSLRLRAEEGGGETLEVNWVLNGCLVFVTVFGFVVSPVVTGWWLADLKRDKKKIV